MNDEELLTKLRQAFKMEAEERLASLTTKLLELEKDAAGARADELLEVAYREAHSLKGASGAVEVSDVETLCQSMESVFSAMKQKVLLPKPALFDAFHEAVSVIESIVNDETDMNRRGHDEEIASLVDRLESLKNGTGPHAEVPASEVAPAVVAEDITEARPIVDDSAQEETADCKQTNAIDSAPTGATDCECAEGIVQPKRTAKPLTSQTVRIAADKLDSLLLKVEELLSLKLMAQQNLDDLRNMQGFFDMWTKKRSQFEKQIGAQRNRIDTDDKGGDNRDTTAVMSGILDHLDWTGDKIQDLGTELKKAIRAGSENQYSLGRMVDDLLDDMKQVTMLPFSTLLSVFPKMIRDLAREQGKEIALEITGSEIEIDKRILEEMKDPLIHLLRNSADHGLEDPTTRTGLGKTPGGTIGINVIQTEGDKVEIVIADNGRGIDPARVRDEAVDRGIISRDDAESLDDQAAIGLIFRSGVSTSSKVTQISGRGLGMAIVQERIESLGGTLAIESTVGEGTCFKIVLPVTLATFRGILVRSGGRRFIVPSVHVDRVVKFSRGAIGTVEGAETIELDGQALSLVALSEVLALGGTDGGGRESAHVIAVVLGSGTGRIAFAVDEVLNEQEVLVKSLGKQLARVRNIAGVTILGSGKPVLIVNVADLLKSAAGAAATSRLAPGPAGERDESRKSILIAEDSITSRTLLKNILESAGYAVTTAVDGFEAFTALSAGRFDLVVSDVEMPRMNGFELTSKIRGTATTAKTPVVLVTALKSPEDRERGFDAGASAYIVKSSFDQSNLLDTLKRLL